MDLKTLARGSGCLAGAGLLLKDQRSPENSRKAKTLAEIRARLSELQYDLEALITDECTPKN